jgi:hypothetical protein
MNFFLILPNQVNKLFEISSVKVKFLLSALRSLLSALLSKARVRAFPRAERHVDGRDNMSTGVISRGRTVLGCS